MGGPGSGRRPGSGSKNRVAVKSVNHRARERVMNHYIEGMMKGGSLGSKIGAVRSQMKKFRKVIARRGNFNLGSRSPHLSVRTGKRI